MGAFAPFSQVQHIFSKNLLVIGTLIVVGVVAIFFLAAGLTRMRRVAIHVSEVCSIFALAISTAFGGALGFSIAASISFAANPSNPLYQSDSQSQAFLFGILGACIGAFMPFAIASIPLSLILLLSEIADNTRQLRLEPQQYRTSESERTGV